MIIYPGTMSEEHFELLIVILRCRSEKVINALRSYFVDGVKRKEISEIEKIDQGYLSRKIYELQNLNYLIISTYPYNNALYKK